MERKNYFYVYVIFRLNGQPCYVGKGSGNRWQRHLKLLSPNPHLRHIMRRAKCKLPIVKVRENITEAEAFETEIALIKAIGREGHGGSLVNMTDGGEGPSGFKMPRRIIKKVAAANTGRRWKRGSFTPEHIEKLRQAKLGTKASRKTRKKMAAAQTGRVLSPQARAKISASKLGKLWSPERKAILKAANRSREPAIRAKISAGLYRYFEAN